MNPGLVNLFRQYQPQTAEEYENALKEIIQHLALLGLWRAKFYEHAAFYGGTCLRIIYGVDRFSEDVDFSLIERDDNFNMNPYLSAIKSELEGFGFHFSVESKEKKGLSPVKSAFVKGNTVSNLMIIEADQEILDGFARNKKVKIKIEVDTDPPPKASFDVKTLLVPIPFQVRLFSPPDLFAGKLHAILCRQWKSRIKGRDYYDLLWFLGQKIPCRLSHLKERMMQTKHLKPGTNLDKYRLIQLLRERLEAVDFDKAKKDVRPFLRDIQSLELWNRDFFCDLIAHIETC